MDGPGVCVSVWLLVGDRDLCPERMSQMIESDQLRRSLNLRSVHGWRSSQWKKMWYIRKCYIKLLNMLSKFIHLCTVNFRPIHFIKVSSNLHKDFVYSTCKSFRNFGNYCHQTQWAKRKTWNDFQQCWMSGSLLDVIYRIAQPSPQLSICILFIAHCPFSFPPVMISNQAAHYCDLIYTWVIYDPMIFDAQSLHNTRKVPPNNYLLD